MCLGLGSRTQSTLSSTAVKGGGELQTTEGVESGETIPLVREKPPGDSPVFLLEGSQVEQAVVEAVVRGTAARSRTNTLPTGTQ